MFFLISRELNRKCIFLVPYCPLFWYLGERLASLRLDFLLSFLLAESKTKE